MSKYWIPTFTLNQCGDYLTIEIATLPLCVCNDINNNGCTRIKDDFQLVILGKLMMYNFTNGTYSRSPLTVTSSDSWANGKKIMYANKRYKITTLSHIPNFRTMHSIAFSFDYTYSYINSCALKNVIINSMSPIEDYIHVQTIGCPCDQRQSCCGCNNMHRDESYSYEDCAQYGYNDGNNNVTMLRHRSRSGCNSCDKTRRNNNRIHRSVSDASTNNSNNSDTDDGAHIDEHPDENTSIGDSASVADTNTDTHATPQPSATSSIAQSSVTKVSNLPRSKNIINIWTTCPAILSPPVITFDNMRQILPDGCSALTQVPVSVSASAQAQVPASVPNKITAVTVPDKYKGWYEIEYRVILSQQQPQPSSDPITVITSLYLNDIPIDGSTIITTVNPTQNAVATNKIIVNITSPSTLSLRCTETQHTIIIGYNIGTPPITPAPIVASLNIKEL